MQIPFNMHTYCDECEGFHFFPVKICPDVRRNMFKAVRLRYFKKYQNLTEI